ncbi:MAG: hypothetical protein VW239_04770 [Candidatus Nanopelagicales bacterium]
MTTTYGTLSSVAGFPVRVELIRRGGSSPAESGFAASRPVGAEFWRPPGLPQAGEWRLSFGPDGFTALLASFDAAKGAALPLAWTPPPPYDGGGAIPVRFLSGTLRRRMYPGGRSECEVELEEVA